MPLPQAKREPSVPEARPAPDRGDGPQTIDAIDLDRLRDHPRNSNVMPDDKLATLRRHVERSGRYPPLIVRPHPEEADAYEMLDGHHRARVLESLGHERAWCVVWRVDDEQALTLLATLNRLEGADDPRRRSALIAELHERFAHTPTELAKRLPEAAADVKKLLSLRAPPPHPAPAPDMADLPSALHLFLTAPQRQRFEHAVEAIGGGREAAVMALIERWEETDADDR